MKKIVLSLFPLVLVVICSVSAFALVLDSGNTNPNCLAIDKYVDVFPHFESTLYFEKYMNKDVYNEELPFMKNNPYIVAYTRKSNLNRILFIFSDAELSLGFYNDNSDHRNTFYYKNNFSNVDGKIHSLTFDNEPLGAMFLKGKTINNPLGSQYVIYGSDDFSNLHDTILYSNFDIRDTEGNILFPATEKTHNTPLPPYQGDIAVKWKDFGNRTENTAENEYLSFSGNALNFEINTGSVLGRSEFVFTEVATGATQTVSCNKFNEVGINQTFDFSIDLRKNVVLKKDTKYTVDFVHVNVFNVKTVASRVGILATADIFDLNERKVSWSTFGNRTTQFGEYLPLDGLFMRFQLYTGDIDKHKYKTYIQEFNNDGQTVGKRLDIPTELFSDPLNSKTTYEFTIYLQRYLSLKMGRKYVFYLEDITSGEIVSSIGFRPTINIVHILNTPNFDNVVETPNYDIDTDIVPMPPSDSDIIPVFPEEDGVVGIGKKITWFFTAITSTIDFIFTSFLNLLDIISNSCTQFIKFLGSFFSYLPKEIIACLSLSFIAIIVLRFLKR